MSIESYECYKFMMPSTNIHSFNGLHVTDLVKVDPLYHCDIMATETQLEIEMVKQEVTSEINNLRGVVSWFLVNEYDM
ncbi:hypothetical protein L1887_07547 [Cichorium endivia]|nr:hypothetical protein L1887_07547 [Cichorium endivia]